MFLSKSLSIAFLATFFLTHNVVLSNSNVKNYQYNRNQPPRRTMSRAPISEIPFETIDLVTKDPMRLFSIWRNEARALPSNDNPDAMSLATVKRDGSPSARTVLLRGIDEKGYKIFTDYRSPKGMEIAGDNRAALIFVWSFQKSTGETGTRQVRIEGLVEKLSFRESQDYFNSEPIIAQIRTAVQNQSKIVTDDRRFLREESKRLLDNYNADPNNYKIPMPKTWGGYRLVPTMMEFYQGTRDDFNDRIRFKKINVDEPRCFLEPGVYYGENNWVYMQLEP